MQFTSRDVYCLFALFARPTIYWGLEYIRGVAQYRYCILWKKTVVARKQIKEFFINLGR